MAALLDEGARGERLREGLSIAILGAPNAGKSSLLNALVGRETAIVSARAGTTRDVVEARLVVAGVPVTLADTAGLREADDEIEAEGIRRALARAEQAELRLLLFASDAPPDAATLALAGPDSIVVQTKADLGGNPLPGGVAVSTTLGTGLDILRMRLAAEVSARAGLGGLTRPRHRAALGEAVLWLSRLPDAPLPELRAEALRGALHALARLTGRVDAEAVLDVVFGEFCIGK
jgi:tRNA modification GTPase